MFQISHHALHTFLLYAWKSVIIIIFLRRSHAIHFSCQDSTSAWWNEQAINVYIVQCSAWHLLSYSVFFRHALPRIPKEAIERTLQRRWSRLPTWLQQQSTKMSRILLTWWHLRCPLNENKKKFWHESAFLLTNLSFSHWLGEFRFLPLGGINHLRCFVKDTF
jgi:hypothetical protein